MYGWLEAGGSTETLAMMTFKDTTPQDVVLRTSFTTNKLVFGNSNATTAGMYIVGNNVGIAKLPDGCALDVHGTIRGDSLFTLVTNPLCNLITSNVSYRIEATSSNISFLATDLSSNNTEENVTMTINTLGVIKNRILIADTLKTPGDVLPYVFIKDVVKNYGNEGNLLGYSATLEAQYKDAFISGDVFQVGDLYFMVENSFVDTDSSNLALKFTNYIEEQKAFPFPLIKGSNVDIQLLRNINPVERVTYSNLIVHDTLYEDIIIKKSDYNEDKSEVTLIITVYDSTNNFIRAGSFYHIKTMMTEETMMLNPDNLIFCKSAFALPAIGSYTSMEVTFSSPEPNASITRYMGPILSLFTTADSVPAVVFPMDAPTAPGMTRPTFNSMLIRGGENVIDKNTIKYIVEFKDETIIRRYLNYQHPDTYIGKYVFILDIADGHSRIWRIREFIAQTLTSGSLLLECQEYNFDAVVHKDVYNLERQAHFLFFKYAEYNIIGDKLSTSYIPSGTRLGVGTFNVPETLTVGGTASVQDMMFLRNDFSMSAFKIVYDSNILGLGNAVSIDSLKETIMLKHTSHFTKDVTISTSPQFKTTLDGRFLTCSIGGVQNIRTDAFGLTKTKLAELEDLKGVAWRLFDIHVHSCVYPCADFKDTNAVTISNGVHLVVDTTVINQIFAGDVIKVIKADQTETLYKVHHVDPRPDTANKAVNLWMSFYFAQEGEMMMADNGDVELYVEDEVLSIEVLRTSLFIGKQSTPRLNADVSSIVFGSDGTEMTLTARIDDVHCNMFIAAGRFYSIHTTGISATETGVENAVILKGFASGTEGVYVLRFKSIDNRTDIRDMVEGLRGFETPAYLYIYPLDTFFQPSMYNTFAKYPYVQHTDTGVYLGFASEHNDTTYIVLRGASSLASYFSEGVRFTISPIDRLIFDDATYEIAGLYATHDHILAKAKYVSPNLMRPYSDARVTYAFNGIPLPVKTAMYPRDNKTVIYTIEDIEDEVFQMMKSYITRNIYVMDKTSELWFVADLKRNESSTEVFLTLVRRNEKVLTPEDRYDFSCKRHIFVVPLKYYIVDELGRDCHIDGKLGIGTMYANERLTVAGDASVRDALVIYNDVSSHPIRVSYCNDIFKIGDSFQLSKSNLGVSVDIDIAGFVTARNFFTNSDQRLKECIHNVNPRDDLKALNDVSICGFKYKGTCFEDKYEKGVIAQEIEKAIPGAVSEKIGFLPDVMCNGQVDEDARTIIIDGFQYQHIAEGDDLQLIIDGRSRIVKVVKVGTNGVEVEESLEPFTRVFVYGKRASIKVVDHVYLFMTCVNAVKALAADVSELKSKHGML